MLTRSFGICALLLAYDPYGQIPGSTLVGARGRKASEKETDPNALSCFEAPVLPEHLFDVYGEEAALQGHRNNTPLKDLCGKEYPELFEVSSCGLGTAAEHFSAM